MFFYLWMQPLQAQLKQREEWAHQGSEAEKRQLSDQMENLSVTPLFELQDQVRKLEQEKNTLQSEERIARAEVCISYIFLLCVLNFPQKRCASSPPPPPHPLFLAYYPLMWPFECVKFFDLVSPPFLSVFRETLV